MIVFDGVSKSYGDLQVLSNVSLTIDAGERVSIIGPGASGKTTLLKLLIGLFPPDQGNIKIFNRDLEGMSERQIQNLLKNVGVAFQQGALFDYMTVKENLSFAMENMRAYSPRERRSRIKRLLAAVKLPHTANMFPYELSGGMQRRVGIARCLCTDPQVAIFDEPTSGLDPVTSTIILNMIHDLAGHTENGVQIIATTSVEIALRFSERIIVIKDAAVAADGQWKDLLVNGSPWVRYFLGVRLKGISESYAEELGLPPAFHDAPLPDLASLGISP